MAYPVPRGLGDHRGRVRGDGDREHFCLSRAEGGVDATFSLEPSELASLVTETERAWQAIGEIRYGPTEAEEKARLLRRSLYIAEYMERGDLLTPQKLRRIRPGLGLPPKYFDLLLGRRVARAVKASTPMDWDLVIADSSEGVNEEHG